MIYLDNAATTKPCKASVEAMNNAVENLFANPSSLYNLGLEAENAIKLAKINIGKILNCTKEEIIFTCGATESNNLAILGSVEANRRNGRHIITTSIEHMSVLNTMKSLESKGYNVQYIKPNEDKLIDVNDILSQVTDETVLVSIMQVNNETGLILPVEEIAKATKLKNKKTIIHVDGVQGFLNLDINLSKSHIDLYTASAHKLYSFKGLGFLYKRKSVKINPIMFGGNQENSLRSGTENVYAIVAFDKAIEFLIKNQEEIKENHRRLKEHLIDKLSKVEDISFNIQKNSVDNIVNLSIKGILSEIMLHYLEGENIYVSSGSACSKTKGSYVLSQLSYDRQIIESSIRISFAYDTTLDDIDKFIRVLNQGIKKIYKK